MKKLAKLCFLVPIPFVLGLVLDIVGYRIGNVAMAKVGISIMSYGTPAIMFILVVVGLILMITGRLSDDEKPQNSRDVGTAAGTQPVKEERSAAREEAEKLADINMSYGYESQMKQAEYQMEHSANAYRNSSKREKVLGWLFFGFLMTDFAMIMVFAFVGIMVGVFVCMGIFAGTIILSLIIKVILEKTSMSRKIDIEKYEEVKGTVVACMLSSMGSVGGGSRHSTMRVTSITYRVVLNVDGKEYNAYSKYVYDEGEVLDVMVRRNGRGVAKIVDKREFE